MLHLLKQIPEYQYAKFSYGKNIHPLLNLPNELLNGITKWLNIKDLVSLRSTCKELYMRTTDALKLRLQRVYWRVSLEYHMHRDDIIIHQVKIRIGQTWDSETCDYCENQDWITDYLGCHLQAGYYTVRAKDIITTVLQGCGGKQLAHLLHNSNYCATLIINSHGYYYPIFSANSDIITKMLPANPSLLADDSGSADNHSLTSNHSVSPRRNGIKLNNSHDHRSFKQRKWTWDESIPLIGDLESVPASDQYIDINRTFIRHRRCAAINIYFFISNGAYAY